MAINKKLIHFNTFNNFNSKKLSANEANTQYTLGVSGEIQEGTPDILYQSIVYIKDTKQHWTHGLIYSGQENNSFPSVSEIGYLYTLGFSNEKISNSETWGKQNSQLTQRLRTGTFGNGYYVVAGVNGEIAYSTNSINWIKLNSFTNYVITGLTYGKGKFLAIDSEGKLWQSFNNPFNWVNIPFQNNNILESITYANGKFVITGAQGLILFSEDGNIWKQVNSNTSNDIYAITYGNGKYVAVGYGGLIMYSHDAILWNIINDDPNISYRTITYGNSKFIIGGSSGIIKYSNDCINWIQTTSNTTSTISYIRGISYLEKNYYAVMYDSSGKGEIWISSDCNNWVVQKNVENRLWCIFKSDSIILTVGDLGNIYTLDLLLNWDRNIPEISDNLYLWEKYFIRLSDGDIITSESTYYNINNANIQAVDTSDILDDVETNTYIKYVVQSLTEEQKAQVRKNIGVLEGETTNLSEYAKKTDLNNKQDTINDLDTIRNGASAGATALQSIPSEYITETELAEAIASAITNTLNTAV